MFARALGWTALFAIAAGCARDPSVVEAWDLPLAGSWQEYRAARGAGPPFRYRIEVVGASANGFSRRATIPGEPNALESTYLVLDGSEFVSEVTTYGPDGAAVSTTTYDPPFPVLSANDARGHSTEITSTETRDGTASVSTRTVVVEGVETVSVPAGVFAALRTTAHVTSPVAGESWNVVWWARGIGRVKMMAWESAHPEDGTTYELTAYGSPPGP